MAVGANALTSWTNAQAMFGYLADEQAKVEKLIDAATARIELYTRRRLKARDYETIMGGSGTKTLILPEYPLNSIASVNVDGSRVFGLSTVVDPSLYGYETDAGMVVLYSGVWASGMANIKATYNAGYDTDNELYPILESACLEYVDWLKSRYSSPGQIGKKGEYSADGVSVSYETEMPMHIRGMLNEFIRGN